MRSLVSSVLAILAGALLAPSCYAERQPPPNFRYVCDSDGDCKDGQSCMDGLCETPCTQETLAEDCPNGELLCLNGVCSSGCDLEKENACPEPQECADLGIDFGGGGSFFSSGSSDTMIGICMRPCTDTSCGELSVCIEGFCVQTCVDDEACAAGLSCQNSLCLPDAGTTTDESDSLTTVDPGSSSDDTATATITDSGTDTGMDTVTATDTGSGT